MRLFGGGELCSKVIIFKKGWESKGSTIKNKKVFPHLTLPNLGANLSPRQKFTGCQGFKHENKLSLFYYFYFSSNQMPVYLGKGSSQLRHLFSSIFC